MKLYGTVTVSEVSEIYCKIMNFSNFLLAMLVLDTLLISETSSLTKNEVHQTKAPSCATPFGLLDIL